MITKRKGGYLWGTSMESPELIAGNQDKLTKSVFINIIDTDFSMKDYVEW